MIPADVRADHLRVPAPDGRQRWLHHVWLRDNCGCAQCRVPQSGERQLFTAAIPHDVAPSRAHLDETGALHVEWHDGHVSIWSPEWLDAHDYSAPVRAPLRDMPRLWDASDHTEVIPRMPWQEVRHDPSAELAFLDGYAAAGAAVLTGVPSTDGTVAEVADRLGHVREVAFERVHNVRHDPTGYNVAHTTLDLKPHTDLPSYHWPPSTQLLHFLVNRAQGGESVLVDGWRVLAELREENAAAFDLLTSVELSWQLCSDAEDTFAVAPMVQLHPDGTVATFRFSNQLALPISADFDTVGAFYDVYRMLGRMVDDERYHATFRCEDGDLVMVHGHRVLHGRRSFVAGSGDRHLQDAYMEHDDLMARRRVLRGTHLPLPATPPTPAVSA
jgi:gamma-butyrobetaine dioxygenase